MKRKEFIKNEKKLSVPYIVLWTLIFSFVFVLLIYFFISKDDSQLLEVLKNKNLYMSFGVISGLIVIFYLLIHKVDAADIALEKNEMENSSFLTLKKMKKIDEFTVSKYSSLCKVDDGIVIGAKKERKDVTFIMTKSLHALVVGTTGSGKTTSFVDQNIIGLGMSRTKPSLVISDPKMELYHKHAKNLEMLGYKINVLNLREPYTSKRWNPMEVLIKRVEKAKELENNCVSENGRYICGDEVFLSHRDVRIRIQELKDEILENAKDLVYTLCPVENRDQPSWEEGARNLILAFVLALCEDLYENKIDKSKLQLFNVFHNITKYCKEDIKELTKYLIDDRDEFSKVKAYANTVLVTKDKTLTSYLGDVNRYMQNIADDGILSMTSESEINPYEFDDMPCATFIIVPDERFTRHRFVTLFATQMYKELVEKANLNYKSKITNTAELKRNTYFILDEFANLPKFSNIESMVTVGRSRKIKFVLVIQSYSQLNSKYGKDIANTIKSNCNVKVYIGSDDYETRRDFSELCGIRGVKNISYTQSGDKKYSLNASMISKPLVSPSMLEHLNGESKGDAIISIRGYEPIYSVLTPSYELKDIYFKEGYAEYVKEELILFEKGKYLYDICGGTIGGFEEIAIEEIIKKEEKEIEQYEKAKEKIKKLDNDFNDIAKEIKEMVKSYEYVITGEDLKRILSCPTGDEARQLNLIANNYSKADASAILGLADNICSLYVRLEEITKEAEKY